MYKVWAIEEGGRFILGEYKESKYAINRANNYQNEANQSQNKIRVEVIDTRTKTIVHETVGEFEDMCEFCVVSSGRTFRGDVCPKCDGKGQVVVRTAPPQKETASTSAHQLELL